MDILVTAARKSLTALCTCLTVDIPGNTYNTFYNSSFSSANDATKWTANGNSYVCFIADQGVRTICVSANNTACWSRIPTMPNGNTSYAGNTGGVDFSGFKVCAANLTSGACCQWTVPAGVTRARFQIWGAGAGALSGCCCGGSINGTTGAYASVIIPVVPGCQYTLCAGCACAVPIRWTTGCTTVNAANSSVSGFGLCNFCAQGGKGLHHYCVITGDLNVYPHGCCRWSTPDCIAGGACICSSGDFCFSTSCASCGVIPFSVSKTTLYYGCYTGTWSATDNIDLVWAAIPVGIPGLNGCNCFDTSFYGTMRHPPIYGFEDLSRCSLLSCTGSNVGGIACNHFDYNYMRYPGAGGTGVFLYAGCTIACAPLTTSSVLYCCNATTYCGGDVGRSGMVCVTYC